MKHEDNKLYNAAATAVTVIHQTFHAVKAEIGDDAAKLELDWALSFAIKDDDEGMAEVLIRYGASPCAIIHGDTNLIAAARYPDSFDMINTIIRASLAREVEWHWHKAIEVLGGVDHLEITAKVSENNGNHTSARILREMADRKINLIAGSALI